jgi:hypothetical protein
VKIIISIHVVFTKLLTTYHTTTAINTLLCGVIDGFASVVNTEALKKLAEVYCAVFVGIQRRIQTLDDLLCEFLIVWLLLVEQRARLRQLLFRDVPRAVCQTTQYKKYELEFESKGREAGEV